MRGSIDMEGERVTCREASNSVCATGECTLFPSGSVAVARMQRNGINLGDLLRTHRLCKFKFILFLAFLM